MANKDNDLIKRFEKYGFECEWYGLGKFLKNRIQYPSADYQINLEKTPLSIFGVKGKVVISISEIFETPDYFSGERPDSGVEGVRIYWTNGKKVKNILVPDELKELCKEQYERIKEIGKRW